MTASVSPAKLCPLWYTVLVRSSLLLLCMCGAARSALAQGGPPYYTNDPGTPGPRNWEINIGYEPFLYSDNSITHARRGHQLRGGRPHSAHMRKCVVAGQEHTAICEVRAGPV